MRNRIKQSSPFLAGVLIVSLLIATVSFSITYGRYSTQITGKIPFKAVLSPGVYLVQVSPDGTRSDLTSAQWQTKGGEQYLSFSVSNGDVSAQKIATEDLLIRIRIFVPEEMVITVPRSMDSQTSDDETPTDVTDVPTGTSSTDVTEEASDTTDVPDSTETTDGESSQETDTVSEESSEPQAEQVVINTGNLVFTLLVGDRLYTAKADYLSSQTPLYAQQTENGWIYSFFIPSSFQEEVSLFLAGGSLSDCSVTLAVQNTLVDCTRFQIFVDKI